MRAFATVAAVAVLLAILPGPVRAQPQLFGDLHRMLSWDADAGADLVLGDVDGDGDLDALIGFGEPRLLLNEGSGVFAESAGQLPPGIATSLALGDVDGDGDLDAMVGNTGPPNGPGNRLLLNDGSGVFAEATGQLPPGGTEALALGDVDGDGDLDAVMPARLFLNDGSGFFSDATSPLSPNPGLPTSIALGDVDADGDLDALIGLTSYVGVPDRLLLNDGSGGFIVATGQLPPILDFTEAVALGDVDGDGDLDALMGNGDLFGVGLGEQNRLYLNDGSGVFADATVKLPAILDTTKAVSLGDVDGDGDLDALVGNGPYKGPGELDRLHLNDGSGVFTDATPQLPGILDYTRGLALGDVDGDGDLDILTANYIGSSTFAALDRLYLNDGSGAFTDSNAQLPPNGGETRAVAAGDVDGDGDLDALVLRSSLGGGPERLLLNDGAGGFSDASGQLPAVSGYSAAVALGDVDGDGDLDALVGDYGEDRLYLNDGSGVFADATVQVPAVLDATQALALGDVDGDGDLDALLGNGTGSIGQPKRLYVNDGSGVFTDATAQLPLLLDSTIALALGDVDGDGDLDALIGNYGQPARLHLNDGSGFLSDASSQLPPIGVYTASIAMGDVDADGDLDALMGSVQLRLLLNDGSGVFADATAQLPADPPSTPSLALGDVDGDGDLDALLANLYQNRLYLNEGSGAFVDATPLIPAGGLGRIVTLADLDGDGDLDAWLGIAGQDRLFSNLTRQIAWRGIPRIGKPLTFDLFGPSWGAFFLGFSFGTANVSMPPLGTLRLDPSSMFFLIGGLLDADGRASLTYPVPANSALVGASLYWQALVAAPARFTNLEITTLTDL